MNYIEAQRMRKVAADVHPIAPANQPQPGFEVKAPPSHGNWDETWKKEYNNIWQEYNNALRAGDFKAATYLNEVAKKQTEELFNRRPKPNYGLPGYKKKPRKVTQGTIK